MKSNPCFYVWCISYLYYIAIKHQGHTTSVYCSCVRGHRGSFCWYAHVSGGCLAVKWGEVTGWCRSAPLVPHCPAVMVVALESQPLCVSSWCLHRVCWPKHVALGWAYSQEEEQASPPRVDWHCTLHGRGHRCREEWRTGAKCCNPPHRI